MKALILAAGMGTRIQKQTNNKPKCLLKINGKSILSHQIDNLEKAGVSKKNIVIVTGYQADFIKAEYPKEITFIHNPNYSTTNSLYSLWLAKKETFTKGMILLNSDVIFHPGVIKKLLEKTGNSIAVDFNKKIIEGEMNVVVNKKNEIVKISKKINPKDASGESVQIVNLDSQGVKILFEECDKIIKNGIKDKFPAYVFEHIIKKKTMKAVDVSGLPWYEIDYNKDYEEAKKIKF